MWPFKKLVTRRQQTETGEQNARRFVKTVAELAKDKRVIICYPDGRNTFTNPANGWPWMMNAIWRARVLTLLQDVAVRGAEFSPPDSLDGWTFTAYSTVPVPRIASLTLEDTL